MYKIKWKKIYKTKHFIKNRFGNIDPVNESEHCEWHMTDNTFTKERADHLAASMEELTGIKHFVIEVESENEAEVETETAENPDVSELIDQLIIDGEVVDDTFVGERNNLDGHSHEWLTAVFDAAHLENSIETLGEIYDELLEENIENLYERST